MSKLKTQHIAEIMVFLFMAVLVALVFHQIATSFVDQGIASGGPYNDAAAYPRFVAFAICLLIALRVFALIFFSEDVSADSELHGNIGRAVLMLVLFGLYVCALPMVGFALSTVLFLVLAMKLGGIIGLVRPVAIAILSTVMVGLFFGNLLNVVLPRGVLNIIPQWMF